MSQTTFSFEIFPPNKESAAEKLTETLDELVGLSPDFISVTCTNKNDDLARLTVKLAGYVKNRLNVPSIAHLPAAYLDKQQVSEILNELETLGVTNLLLKESIPGSDSRKKSAWTFWFTANLNETTWSNILDSILKDTSSPKKPGCNHTELAASSHRLFGATFQEKTRLPFAGRFMRKSRRKKSSKGC